MLKSIKEYFDTYLLPDAAGSTRDPDAQIRMAVAVLLIEIAEADFEQAPEERSAVLEAIERQFQLDRQAAQTLMRLAEREHAESTDYFQFTSLINRHYSPEQKIKVIESLWRVAFADQQLHHYEEHVIRRLAELIYVSHKDFIAAKHRVMSAL